MLSLGLVSLSQSPELLARVEAAVASQRAAVDLEPQSAAAYRALAEAYAQHKFMRAASTHLATAVALEPANAEAYRLLGTVLRRTGDEAGTRRAYDAALALDPSFGLAYFNLGNMLPRGPEQLRMYELAAELDPTHRGAWMNLANAHLSAGRVEEQLKALRWLAKIDPVEGRSRLTNALTLQERSLEVAALWKRAADAGAPPSADAVEWHAKVEAAAAGAEAAPEKCLARRCIEGFEEAARLPAAPVARVTSDDGVLTTAGGTLSSVEELLLAAEPTLIAGGARGWPPTETWDAAYLSGEAGADELEVTVQPVAGAFEVHPDRIERPPKTNVRVADFVRLLALRRDVNLTLYSRQAPLWSLPRLLADLRPNPWMERLRLKSLNVWLGDGHFRNTLHFDPHDNFLCQTKGSKLVLLWEPAQADNLYYADRLDVQAKFSARRGEYDRRETDIVSSNTASVNMAAPDLAAFPKLADALKVVRAVTVAAGDCLYLPRRWHHHVFTEADPDEGFNAAVNIWIDREKTLQEHHEVTAGLHHAYHGGRPTFADVLAAIGGGSKAKVKLVPHPEHGLAHDEL